VATGNTSSASTVSTYVDLYEKTNTNLKTAIKLTTEEADWSRQIPKEKIKVSGNEMRVVLQLKKPNVPAAIPDGGFERTFMSAPPVSGTFTLTQLNMRYNFTGLGQALDNKSKAAMIENQIDQQALMAAFGISRGIGLQWYGSSTASIAVVKTTGSAGATQNGLALKNAFGSAVFAAGTTTSQNTYLSSLFRVNDPIALVRAGAIVEFGKVTASPSAGSGVGFIDSVFNSSITPTVGDVIVFAGATTDATITGTDTNQWTIGMTDILTATSLHGVTDPNWLPGYTSTASVAWSFAMQEAMANGIANASAMKMNRVGMSQGVRRNAIATERGNKRYDGDTFTLDGDLKSGTGVKYLTSPLFLPGTVIGWYDHAIGKVELSEQPADEGGRGIFSLDKVQDKSQIAAKYDYFFAKVCGSRGAFAYAANVTES
jgi:hypothetical protein